jgi:uncharacterized protein YbaA (DUF1428 family)
MVDYYLEKGMSDKDWYSEEAKSICTLLPEFKGLPILRCFAVTSMTTSIEANVHLAIKALVQLKKGKQFTGFLPNQITYLNLIKEGKDVPGRKIQNFINALEGNEDSVVVDIWMCKLFGTIRERDLHGRTYYLAPTTREYNCIETFVRQDAKRVGITPRQYQACVWSAIKKENSTISKNVSWSILLHKKRGMFNY